MRKVNIILVSILMICSVYSPTVLAGEKPVAIQIVAGGNHTLALDEDGNVYAWGSSMDGQLGLGSSVYQTNIPTKIDDLSNISFIEAGENQSLVIDSDGNVWAWGRNDIGQLGLGDEGWDTNRTTPELNPYLSNIVQIASGGNYTFAVDKNGHVFAWGYNGSGQLGFGDGTNRNTPEQIPNLNDIEKISVGNGTVFAIDSDGNVWAWGNNGSGRLGMGSSIYDVPTPTQVSGLSNIVQITSGSYFSFALDENHDVWYWGDYDDFNLSSYTPALYESLSNISQISIGYNSDGDYAVAVDTSGNVYSLGQNEYGRLGLGDEIDRQSPVQIASLAGASKIATGGMHAFAITSDGVYGWGYNFQGQLGPGDNENRLAPTKLDFFASNGDTGDESNEPQTPANGDFLLLPGLNEYGKHAYIRANEKEQVNKADVLPSGYNDVVDIWR